MTPDRRLDQLEPLMADSLQKIDRLIEGQGQLTEIATRADQNADTAARGVANLTIQTQQGFVHIRQDIGQLDEKATQVDEKVDRLREEMAQQIGSSRREITQLDKKVDSLREEMAQQVGGLREDMAQQVGGLREEMAQEVGGLREEMNQRFDQLITLITDRLS